MEEHLKKAIIQADSNMSNISDAIKQIDGMSGMKTRHFLNNLLNMPGGDVRYLEIGSWKGSSLCAAMYMNSANIVCIDNWSEFGGPRDEFLNNMETFRGQNTVRYIEQDSWTVDVSTLPSFNMYMYDGEHSQEGHTKALTHYYPCLDDTFIFVVDDWNWEKVRTGTFDAIKALGLKIDCRFDILPSKDGYSEYRDGWWNGMGAFVLSKRNTSRVEEA